MAKINLEEIDSIHYDVLKELGNIGAGNATTALSQLLNMKLDMKVPKVDLVGFDQLAPSICDEEELVVGIYLMLEGDIQGSMMFMVEKKAATCLVNQLMGRPVHDVREFDEMDLSALQEIGNIITGAYLSSLSTLTRLTITASIPYMSIDMAAAILSVPAIEFGKVGDKALLIETQFGDEILINGYFILIPELESYDKILASLGL
ncbi:chemotaxis protein CheC [Lachnotalea glycerini]|uniref:Chemotaxis protein CheC n=1 Tax=Lachnotalea glycerini TaxID=1763509 RepID=A0A255I2B2_9FIRM|nr:chemotaxis protein CheC [Lachnotalea glycerini]PXV93530.1 chemotaxis protein CheC [Lachnotalea glycerini]RDY32491.1 chemotaxis protein CheC [Lachnotalea glycerini]